jgi:Zn-finger nucleic acid-binding protein
MQCPRCTARMRTETLAGHHGQPIAIDVCLPCQAMWFDGFESVSLSPASTLKLFRLIGEHAEATPQDHTDTEHCPRCGTALRVAHDLQRSTRRDRGHRHLVPGRLACRPGRRRRARARPVVETVTPVGSNSLNWQGRD